MILLQGRGGGRERDKPRAVGQLEEELRAALRRSLCSPKAMSPPIGMGLDAHADEGGGALAEALRRLAEVTRPCGDLVALISHGYSHIQHHLDATLRRLHAAETLLGQTDATQREREATRRRDLGAVNADLTQRLEESEARSRALVCEMQQLEEVLGVERRRGHCLEEDMRGLEARLLEVSVWRVLRRGESEVRT
ncbi:uncharacterized protein LOC135107203 [Scylla paramamosain]|uniref:uncharacterized protein LOC135107203 n=1 Tax=Scylla paramamosain TaxID=85552 RepID=UPI003083BB15